MTSDILTLQEASALLRFHERTLKTWIKEGRLPAFRVKRGYRIRRRDIEALFTRIEDKGTGRPVRPDNAGRA